MERSILSKIKRSFIGLLPRQFHCFSLGAEKTGTTTIHHMLKHHYRSRHEPEPEKHVQLVIDYLEGIISRDSVSGVLKKRDRLLNLEMESAHHFVYVSDILVELFPDAKFIITVREPYSLLNSRLNWYSRPFSNPGWQKYRAYFLENRHKGYEPEEERLKELGIYSIDTFLSQYADHYRRVLTTIPEDRRLLIKTNQLNDSINDIAHFLDIAPGSIRIHHANKNKKKTDLLEDLDPVFVRNRIWDHCSELIRDFFPETVHLYNR